MPVNLKGRSFLTLMDFTPGEIRYLLDLGHNLKAKKRSGVLGSCLRGKNIALLFEKTSTRTRCAFEVAVHDEGGNVTFLEPGSSQMGKKESMEDTAKVLGRFFDGIEYRGYDQKVVETLAKFSGVPVYNGLTDDDHPTQIIADFMTLEEHVAKPLNRQKLVFVGDVRNNMCYALMFGCCKMGVDFVGYGPRELIDGVDQNVMERVRRQAEQSGAKILLDHRSAGASRCRCRIFRHLGVHGRGGQDSGPNPAADPLSGGRTAAGRHPQSRRDLYALPALVPRYRNGHGADLAGAGRGYPGGQRQRIPELQIRGV